MTGTSRSPEQDATLSAPGDTNREDDRTIVITRLLDAPRELVRQAWTDLKHVGRWWGPRGFTPR